MAETQTYQNHTRWYPLVHFVIVPLLTFNLIWQVVRLWQEPNWDRAENLLMALVFVMISVAARLQALKAQDRVIRLEEELRYHRVLSPELAKTACDMRAGQKIALRFAPDEELSTLVPRIVSGELATGKEIKLAIKNWRGDHHRV